MFVFLSNPQLELSFEIKIQIKSYLPKPMIVQ
jgi:hypothetical protein